MSPRPQAPQVGSASRLVAGGDLARSGSGVGADPGFRRTRNPRHAHCEPHGDRDGRPPDYAAASVFFRAGETISVLVAAMALAGFRPLGQTWVQFMMVWQR